VARYNPTTGALMRKYKVPFASQVTSCAFGGPNLDQLYITTASAGLPAGAIDGDERNAGHLFVLDLSGEGVRGVESFSYKL
jgi:sugar lactone lactonase YvrE